MIYVMAERSRTKYGLALLAYVEPSTFLFSSEQSVDARERRTGMTAE